MYTLQLQTQKIALELAQIESAYAMLKQWKMNTKVYFKKLYSVYDLILQNIKYLCEEIKLIYKQMHEKLIIH